MTTNATVTWSAAYYTSTYPIISYELQQNWCNYQSCSNTWEPCKDSTGSTVPSHNIMYPATSFSPYTP